MLIIGEKINGTRKEVGAAIAARDAARIRGLARAQVEAGAQYLDVNAGTAPENEPEDLVWLVRTVQEEVDVPLCLDSPNSAALRAALLETRTPPLINSISGEPYRLAESLPLAAKHGCPVLALALDDTGMPKNVDDRMRVIRHLFEETRKAGIPDASVYVDPLIIAVSTGDEQGNIVLETIRRVRAEFPEAHVTGGLSNVSFGMPARTLINRAFLVLTTAAGLDSAIMDPTDRELLGILLAAEALLGQDRFCRNYNRAFRAGRIGKPVRK
jgi:5-methyltetrahydrofolate--homocysteine methyltransferase